jgi:hypothetical protein
MCSADIISMPDKWEYPWYATWDVAFHVVSLSLVDPEFAKSQVDLILSDRYLHPSGRMPSCEWNFDDVSPPVHAWATIFTYRLFQDRGLQRHWMEHVFQKLLLNFTWWANRKDRSGHNVLEGGLIGLDNVSTLDRHSPLAGGGYVEQADGAAWMALYAQNMFEIAMALLEHDSEYIEMVLKFLEHFLWIASAMGRIGPQQTRMWDEKDGFFYDVLRFGDGGAVPLKVRSLLGLVPLCAATVFDGAVMEEYPQATERFCRFLDAQPDLIANIHDLRKPGQFGRLLLSVLDEHRLRRVLARALDESEFLSAFGIRSMSRYHAEHPYIFRVGDYEHRIAYAPGNADTGIFGGNANWRGPIWLPINAMIVRALLSYYRYYGDTFRVECPTGSGRLMNLYEVAQEIVRRLTSIFVPGSDRRRPVFGDIEKFFGDPYWRDYIPFHEYFHGDTGAGLGASHQTGWTGIIARLIHLFATTTADEWLRDRPEKYLKRPLVEPYRRERSILDRRHSLDRRGELGIDAIHHSR